MLTFQSAMKFPLKFLLLLLSLFYAITSSAQIQTCTELKDGIFYSYPKNSDKQYEIKRNGDYQEEIDLATGDTSKWKVAWINDCTYSLIYLSGSTTLKDDMKAFMKSHKLVTVIENISGDFYTYKLYIDKAVGKFILSDTIWAQKKPVVTNNTLFESVSEKQYIKKLNSKNDYALLYVYRPGKFAGSKGEYILYFDDNIMCISKNKSAYIFKIFKEGNFKLSAKLYNQKEVTQNIEIKLGQKFYLKAGVKFVATTASGWRPDLLIIDSEKGSDEFSEIEVSDESK